MPHDKKKLYAGHFTEKDGEFFFGEMKRSKTWEFNGHGKDN